MSSLIKPLQVAKAMMLMAAQFPDCRVMSNHDMIYTSVTNESITDKTIIKELKEAGWFQSAGGTWSILT